jgi:hypothetical protein
MNDFVILLISLAFGALAWGMLVVSDWLLGDRHESKGRPPRRVH